MASVASVKRVVTLALILDLLAFTIPLPLFPRIIEWYTNRELGEKDGFLSRTLDAVSTIRSMLYSPAGSGRKQWDIVLLGGLLGSLFSALQFVVSPFIGRLSDTYGRKPILLMTMIGNVLSALVWIQSTSFASFLLARAIGGLSEGNVQISIAILSDVTSPATRARALALVGLAFSVCFSTGPLLGAYFAGHPFAPSFGPLKNVELNVYATPAALTAVLLLLETAFLIVWLPETRGFAVQSSSAIDSDGNEAASAEKLEDAEMIPAYGTSKDTSEKHPEPTSVIKGRSVQERLDMLRSLRRIHFFFLIVFSGVEFTLTFLSFDLFDWDNSQNGRLLGVIGVLSSLLQGGYVRRSIRAVGEGVMASRGVQSCIASFVVLASLPYFREYGSSLIYIAAAFLAFTSATAVNALTALASLQCDETVGSNTEVRLSDPRLLKGRALGEFRSAGQLGRALGPLLACSAYWTIGPSATYFICAVAMTVLSVNMRGIATKPKRD